MYTPKNLHEIVFPSPAENLTVSSIAYGHIKFPSDGITGILLQGQPGTGKSTLAGILPALIEASQPNGGNSPDVQRHKCINGKNGVELIKSIKTQLSLISINPGSGIRFIILDEVDNLTPQARAQLKIVMEMPDAIFILTTNNAHRLEAALRSRCVEVPFNPTDPQIWLPRLHEILKNQGINSGTFSDGFLLQMVSNAKCDARQIMLKLQMAILSHRAQTNAAINATSAVAAQPTTAQPQAN